MIIAEGQDFDAVTVEILSVLPDQVAVINGAGEVVAYNSGWQKNSKNLNESWIFPLLGENVLEQLKNPLSDKIYNALHLTIMYKSVLSGKQEKAEFEFETKGDKTRWYSIEVNKLQNKDLFLIIARDVTAKINEIHLKKEYKIRVSNYFNNKIYGIVTTDETLQILEANTKAADVIGVENQELKGQSISNFISIPDQLRIQVECKNIGEVFLGRTTLTDQAGDTRILEMNVSEYVNYKRKRTFNFIFKDVTGEERAKVDVMNRRKFLQSAVDALPAAYFVVDINGNLQQWNSTLETEFEYSAAELEGMNILNLVHADDKAKINRIFNDGFSMVTRNLDVTCVSKSGEKLHYLISGKSFYNDGVHFIVGGGINRNDFVSLENERHWNEMLFSQLFHKAHTGIVLVNSEGKIQRLNNRFSGMFGWKEQEIIDKPLWECIGKNGIKEVIRTNITKALQGESLETEAVRYRKDGTEIPVFTSTLPITIEGEPVSAYCIYQDISEIEESKKIIKDQLKEKRILIQEIHHRVKNNLAIISGLVELESAYNSGYGLKQYIKTTQTRIQSIAKIHEVMYRSNDLTCINILEYFQEMKNSYEGQKNVEVRLDCPVTLELNVNMAIPFGILVNEFVNEVLIFAENTEEGNTEILVGISECEENGVSVKLSALKDGEPILLNQILSENSLSTELINILCKQLEADHNPDASSTGIEFEFKRKNQRGAHSMLV